MTDWIDYTQCPECGKHCQNGGHCIGGMGGKDTKCPGFIRYVPKIRVEKDVWESTLNRSMVLETENDKLKKWCEELNAFALKVAKENAQLKELLKECRRYIDIWGYTDIHGNALLPQIDEVLK